MARAVTTAAESLGFPYVPDLNGDPVQRPCIGPTPRNIAGGMRMNAAFIRIGLSACPPVTRMGEAGARLPARLGAIPLG